MQRAEARIAVDNTQDQGRPTAVQAGSASYLVGREAWECRAFLSLLCDTPATATTAPNGYSPASRQNDAGKQKAATVPRQGKVFSGHDEDMRILRTCPTPPPVFVTT
jgi:hypothetical protein